MKIELSFKTSAQLTALLELVLDRKALLPYYSFNIPNKMRDENLVPFASQIINRIPSANVCLHYSLKNHRAKSLTDAAANFAYCVQESANVGVTEMLLVSGSGDKRNINAVTCLQKLQSAGYKPPEGMKISVAFNPYYSSEAEKTVERERLLQKLQTGYISILYLQFGSDIAMLRDSMLFLSEVVDRCKVQIFGSVFLPSKQLIARMKFRPWKGLLLSEEFLSGIEPAEAILKKMLKIYEEFCVTPIIETAFRNDKEAEHMERLLGLRTIASEDVKVTAAEAASDPLTTSKKRALESIIE